MPIYKNGNEASKVYYHGQQIGEVYYYGNLVYKLGGGITTDGNNYKIAGQKLIKYARDLFDSRTGESTHEEGTTPLSNYAPDGLEIPSAKDNWSDYSDNVSKNYTSNMEYDETTYPGGQIHYDLGSGDKYTQIPSSGTVYSYVNLNTALSINTPIPNYPQSTPTEYTFAVSNGIRGSGTTPGTYHITWNMDLKCPITDGYGSIIYTIRKFEVKKGDEVAYTQNINITRTVSSSTTINFDLDVYITHASGYTGNYNFYLTIEASRTGTIHNTGSVRLQSYASAKAALMHIIHKTNWDVEMVFTAQAYEDGFIYEDPETHEVITDSWKSIQMSLTPKSEYDPTRGTGLADTKINSNGVVYELTEYA